MKGVTSFFLRFASVLWLKIVEIVAASAILQTIKWKFKTKKNQQLTFVHIANERRNKEIKEIDTYLRR